MRYVFFALAIWGASHPMYYFMSYMAAKGWSLTALSDAWYVNDSTTGLTWDLISRRKSLTSVDVAARAVSPARRFFPASRNSFDQL